MHVMFIHPNFPAQFGHIAHHLSTEMGWQSTCVTSVDTTGLRLPFTHVNYRLGPGPQPKVFHNPPNLAGLLQHAQAVYRGLKSAPQIRPDLVVGHMSYGTLLYLKLLYDCPMVGYFELLPPPFWSEALTLRSEFPPPESVRMFNATYHTLTLLHAQMVDAAYTPTQFQLSTAPADLRGKTHVIHDGIDTEFFSPREVPRPLEFRGLPIAPRTRVVTYVSRGLESARGFDVFMRMAAVVAKERADVQFFIAGEDRTHYGHEGHHIGKQTFKDYVLSQGDYDTSRFHFLGRIPLADLQTLLRLSDLHVYLTVPYVLSWSLMQAMASGCTILASATPPVEEVIRHERQGLLAGFDDVDALASRALEVLDRPEQFRHLGHGARQRILKHYERRLCSKRLAALFEEVASSSRP